MVDTVCVNFYTVLSHNLHTTSPSRLLCHFSKHYFRSVKPTTQKDLYFFIASYSREVFCSVFAVLVFLLRLLPTGRGGEACKVVPKQCFFPAALSFRGEAPEELGLPASHVVVVSVCRILMQSRYKYTRTFAFQRLALARNRC